MRVSIFSIFSFGGRTAAPIAGPPAYIANHRGIQAKVTSTVEREHVWPALYDRQPRQICPRVRLSVPSRSLALWHARCDEKYRRNREKAPAQLEINAEPSGNMTETARSI